MIGFGTNLVTNVSVEERESFDHSLNSSRIITV